MTSHKKFKIPSLYFCRVKQGYLSQTAEKIQHSVLKQNSQSLSLAVLLFWFWTFPDFVV